MFSWIAGKLIARTMADAREGNRKSTLRLYAKDIRFRFPGNNAWSIEVDGKDGVARWLDRVDATGVKLHPDEVILKGFPWRQTVCIRGHDVLDSPDGERIYENRFVIWGRISWGLLRDYEVYEDTERVAVLEEHLAKRALDD